MPSVTNRSEETWEFGDLVVPPGVSLHTTEAVEHAMATTCMGDHMMDAADLRAPEAKFVLDMEAPEGRPAEVTEAVEAAKELETKLPLEEYRAKLEGHTRAQLREMAADIDGSAKMSKADLVDALVAAAE